MNSEDFNTIQDPEKLWKIINRNIELVLDRLCPVRKLVIPESKPKWLTRDIILLMRDRDYFFARARRNNRADDWNISRFLRNRVNQAIKNHKATKIKRNLERHKIELGPILFSIYINNLGLLLDDIQIYADDAVIYSTDLMTLQDNLNAVVAWSNRNLLTLNKKKTKWMIIGKNTRYVGEDNNLYVNGAPLEQVFSFNYLGLIIDTSLDFREHRAKVMKQVQLKLNYLVKIRKYLNTDAALTIYKSTILYYLSLIMRTLYMTSKLNTQISYCNNYKIGP